MDNVATTTETVSVPEAAQLLGLTVEEAYDLVFTRRIASIEAPSGRRLVPRSAVQAYKDETH